MQKPWIKRFIDSVPPEVKTISVGFTLRWLAMELLAFDKRAFAIWPKKCTDEGLDGGAFSSSIIALDTSGATAVVALLSR